MNYRTLCFDVYELDAHLQVEDGGSVMRLPRSVLGRQAGGEVIDDISALGRQSARFLHLVAKNILIPFCIAFSVLHQPYSTQPHQCGPIEKRYLPCNLNK